MSYSYIRTYRDRSVLRKKARRIVDNASRFSENSYQPAYNYKNAYYPARKWSVVKKLQRPSRFESGVVKTGRLTGMAVGWTGRRMYRGAKYLGNAGYRGLKSVSHYIFSKR